MVVSLTVTVLYHIVNTVSSTFLNFFKKNFFGCFVACCREWFGLDWVFAVVIYIMCYGGLCMVRNMYCVLLPCLVGCVWVVSNMYCTLYYI